MSFVVEVRDIPNTCFLTRLSEDWVYAGPTVEESTFDTLEGAVKRARDLWHFDRISDGCNWYQYRVRRLSDQHVVFTMG